MGYASYPFNGGGGGGVPTYPDLASFPSAVGAGNGALAIALDTDILYISNGTVWEPLADPAFSPNAITALHGDGTATGPGDVALTLAVVNSNVGTFGSASAVPVFDVNAKGLITGVTNTPIQIAESQVTNLVSDLAGKVPITRLINTTAPITGGGALSSDLTLALTQGDLTDAGTDGITIGNGTGAVVGTGTTISQHVADSTHNGYLSQTDWSTFNGKQASGNYITALTGDVTASGPGSVAATLTATTNATLTTLSGLTTASSLATVGTITSGTWNATTIAINHGGTGQTSKTAAFDALSPATTKGDLIVFNGTNNVRQAVGTDGFALVADSAQTTGIKYAAVLLNPMTTLGDIIYENATPAPTRLAGNTTTTNKFLTQTGTGSASAAPVWNVIAGTDLPAVTSLSDAVATAQGSKQYSHGTSYNGGNAPTITLVGGGGTLSSVAEGDFVPYQMQDGSWRCIFNITVAVSITTRSQLELNVDGITFFDTGGGSSYGPTISAFNDGGLAFVNAYLENNNGRMIINHLSTVTSKYSFSGDARLASKPMWAY